jgi:hypothetical protein
LRARLARDLGLSDRRLAPAGLLGTELVRGSSAVRGTRCTSENSPLDRRLVTLGISLRGEPILTIDRVTRAPALYEDDPGGKSETIPETPVGIFPTERGEPGGRMGQRRPLSGPPSSGPPPRSWSGSDGCASCLAVRGRTSVHERRAVAWRGRNPFVFANSLSSLSGFSSLTVLPVPPRVEGPIRALQTAARWFRKECGRCPRRMQP